MSTRMREHCLSNQKAAQGLFSFSLVKPNVCFGVASIGDEQRDENQILKPAEANVRPRILARAIHGFQKIIARISRGQCANEKLVARMKFELASTEYIDVYPH